MYDFRNSESGDRGVVLWKGSVYDNQAKIMEFFERNPIIIEQLNIKLTIKDTASAKIATELVAPDLSRLLATCSVHVSTQQNLGELLSRYTSEYIYGRHISRDDVLA